MPNELYEKYRKLGLLKPVLAESNQYSDNPEGELDVDRLISGKPAFQSISDSVNYKNKKLVIQGLDLLSEMDQLKTLMAIRQLMQDGFEIVQYRRGRLRKLDSLSLSSIFKYRKEQYDFVHQKFMTDTKTAYDDITVIDSKILLDIFDPVKVEELWESDLMEVKLASNKVQELTDQFPIKKYISNTFSEGETCKEILEHFQETNVVIIQLTEAIRKKCSKQEMTVFEQQLISDISCSDNLVFYLALLNHVKEDHELYRETLQAKSVDGTATLYWLAERQLMQYVNLLNTLKEKDAELFEIALKAQHSSGTHVLYWLSQMQPNDYFALLNTLKDKALFEFALKAQHSSGMPALYQLAQDRPDWYFDLLNTLKEKNVALFEFALKVQNANGSYALHQLAYNQTDKYFTLLDTLRNEKDAKLFEFALKAQHSSGTNALVWVAVKHPDQYFDLLKALEEKNTALFEVALKVKLICQDHEVYALYYLAKGCSAKYQDLLDKLKEKNFALYQFVQKVTVSSVATAQFLLSQEPSSGAAAAAQSSPIHPPVNPDYQTIRDANTGFQEETFHLNRIFYHIAHPDKHPEPRDYRLSSFNKIKINEHSCKPDSVFTLCNADNVTLEKPPHPILFSHTDVYQAASQLQEPLKSQHFYAKTTLLLSNQWQALPSLDPNEQITKIHTDPPKADIEIQYSKRDHLYYIRRKDNVVKKISIDYLVEIPVLEKQAPTDDLKKLIDYCAGFRAGNLDMHEYQQPTGQDYLMALAEQKVGACRHRTAVFKALLDNPDLRNKIPGLEGLDLSGVKARVISNVCHDYIEVKVEVQGTWMKYNLGGYSVELEINEDANPLQQKEMAKPAKQGIKEDRIEPIPLPDIRSYFPTPEKKAAPELTVYAQAIISKDESQRLIECAKEQLPGMCYALQKYCQDTSHAYYYIHSPEDLILRRPYIKLQENNSGIIQKGLTGPVHQFLTEEKRRRILIVNFANFSAQDLVRFNSLFDDAPSIDGIALPVGTKVIGLIQEAEYKDASLYSRFGQAIESCPVAADKLPVPSPYQVIAPQAIEAKTLEIDFYGAPNWRAKLFGSWRLQGDNLHFEPGVLVTQLEKKQPIEKIILKNPPLVDPDFTRFFQEANLKGYIEYEGRRVDWTRPTVIIKDELTLASQQIKTIQYGLPHQSIEVINPSVFSRFLKQYDFRHNEQQQGQLFEVDGILAKYAEQSLAIYVSDNLSDAQWSQLLEECRKYHIQLNINLAPTVTLPLALFEQYKLEPAQPRPPAHFNAHNKPLTDCCIASTDPDLTIASWSKIQPDVICMTISEAASSDLLIKVAGKLNEERLALYFSKEAGALLNALDQNKTVILHGNFTHDMRQRLQAFLFERQKKEPRTGQVVIIADQNTAKTFESIVPVVDHPVTVEEKSLHLAEYQKQIQSPEAAAPAFIEIDNNLPFITQKALLRHAIAGASKEKPWVGLKTNLPLYQMHADFDLSTAKEQTEQFNDARLTLIQKTLAKSPFVFLAGMTGVGKTTFVEKVWKNSDQGRILYVGDNQLRQWAEDKSPGVKAIFIDEANITQQGWTQFEDLFHNKPPGIMIGNQYISLSSDHKIIFAGNPTTYSEDRALPILFERHGNSVVFDPLPPAYIYHEMLLPLFNAENRFLSEKIGKPILALNQYLNGLSRDAILLTPRELIMMTQLAIHFCEKNKYADPARIAQYFAYQLSRQFVPKSHLNAFDEEFKVNCPVEVDIAPPKGSHITMTDANRPSAHMLTTFLTLRQSYIDNKITRPAGLGGMTLESEPGLGKSELAIACLQSQGLSKRSLDDKADPPAHQKYFYHLPAAANAKVKREILIRAFDEGAIVLCDEINAAASQENLLNRLLMGTGPHGEAPKKSGFLLIGTQNPTSMAGRAKTSAALLHRMHYRVIPHYTEPEMRVILQNRGLPDRRSDALIAQYRAASKENTALCFRDVIKRAEEDLTGLLGKPAREINKADLLGLARDENSHTEILEVVVRHPLCDDEVRLTVMQQIKMTSNVLNIIFEKSTDFNSLMTIVDKQLEIPKKKQAVFSFFSEEPTLDDYPPAPIIALIKLYKLAHPEISGQYVNEIDTLIETICLAQKNTLQIINDIDKLIRSGKIEKEDRLESVLIEIVDTVKKLDCLKKTQVYDELKKIGIGLVHNL